MTDSYTLEVLANIRRYAQGMAEVPGVTEKQAARAALGFQKQLFKAQDAAAKHAKEKAGEAANAWGDVGEDLKAAIGVAAIAGAVAALDEVAGRIDAITDAATRSNLETTTVEALGQAARVAGGQLEDLDGVLNQFVKRQAEAATGTGKIASAYQQLGVDVADANGNLRNSDAVFREVVAAIAAIEDPAQRAAAAVAIFGKGAGPLLETGLLSTSGALDVFEAQVRQFGMVSAPGAADAADQWQASMAQLKLVLDGTAASMFANYGPAAADLLDKFTLGFVAMRELGVVPLQLAFNWLVRGQKAAFALIKLNAEGATGLLTGSLDRFNASLREGTDEFNAYQTQIEAQLKTGFEAVYAFHQQQQGIAAVTSATTAGTDATKAYRIENTEATKAAKARAAAEKQAAEELEQLYLNQFLEIDRNRRAAEESAVAQAVAAENLAQAKLDLIASINAAEEEAAAKRAAEEEARAARIVSTFDQALGAVSELAAQAAERQAESNAAAASRLFAFSRAAAIGQISVNAAVAVMQALAQLGPVAGGAAAIGIGLTAAAQVGAVLAQEAPSYALGGVATVSGGGGTHAPGDDVRLSRRELFAVLNQRGLQNAGGPGAIRALNRGQMPWSAPPAVPTLGSRLEDHGVQLRRHRPGATSSALDEGRTPGKARRPRR